MLPFDTQFSILYFYLFSTTTKKKNWTKNVLNKWIMLDLLMEKKFNWLRTKIMIIKVHQMQAG